MNQKILVLVVFTSLFLISCSSEKAFVDTFMESPNFLKEKSIRFNCEEIGKAEDIDCFGSILVTHDRQQGYMFGLFSTNTGEFKTRFGTIGQGEGEISLGTWGKLWKNEYYVFNGFSGNIYRYYSLESDKPQVENIKYSIQDSHFSQIAPVNTKIFLGMGIYHERFRYVLFDKENHALDSVADIAGIERPELSFNEKLLMNQGLLIRCADSPLFVSTLNYSSNIDFLEVQKGKINVVCSYKGDDLVLNPSQKEGSFSAHPTEESITGFLDLAGTDKYVFALYSDLPFLESKYMSQTVLVFDWSGRKIAKLKLDSSVKSIAAHGNTLYTLGPSSNGDFEIKSYSFKL